MIVTITDTAKTIRKFKILDEESLSIDIFVIEIFLELAASFFVFSTIFLAISAVKCELIKK